MGASARWISNKTAHSRKNLAAVPSSPIPVRTDHLHYLCLMPMVVQIHAPPSCGTVMRDGGEILSRAPTAPDSDSANLTPIVAQPNLQAIRIE
jgi:hypothetical protein